jgi:DNA-binding ferritin-like protein (Dps family)
VIEYLFQLGMDPTGRFEGKRVKEYIDLFEDSALHQKKMAEIYNNWCLPRKRRK